LIFLPGAGFTDTSC